MKPQYEIMRASITDADCLKAFDLLRDHIGYSNRIAIEEISKRLFDSRNDNSIRKTRDVVEILRTDYGIPICSSSGKAGRWLASTEDEKQECLADFRSRRSSLDAVIKALERAKVPPPIEFPKLTCVTQETLF